MAAGTIELSVSITEIPPVRRLMQAIGNIVAEQPDGHLCTCGIAMDNPMIKRHSPSCTELNEAIKAIKDKGKD